LTSELISPDVAIFSGKSGNPRQPIFVYLKIVGARKGVIRQQDFAPAGTYGRQLILADK
jgi:hypothetical protein